MTDRQETGGPNRTPRSEITSAAPSTLAREPVVLLDLSTSMDWSAENEDNRAEDFPSPKSRRAIVIDALPLLVSKLESQDSMATAEQSSGSDEKGGLLAFGFADQPTEIGDLNSSNIARRLNGIKWGGGTNVVPALKLAIRDYNNEFGDDPDRAHMILILTDGQAQDWKDLEPYLLKATMNRVFVVGIVGHGEKALGTYNEYTQVAQQNKAQDPHGQGHVRVILWDAVTDPAEIGEDLVTLVG